MSDAVADGAGQRAGKTLRQRAPRVGYRLNFWLVFTATSAIGVAANLFVFFPVYIVKLGGDAAAIGAIVAVGALAALAARPGFVPLTDRRGRRTTALWSLVLEALAIVLYIPVHSLGWPIYAVRVMQGAVDGTARVALFALVFDILPEGRRGEAMALFSLSGQGPAAVGPLVGEALLKYFGFDVLFCVAAMLCLVAAAATAMLPDDHLRDRLRDHLDDHKNDHPDDHALHSHPPADALSDERSPGASTQRSASADTVGYRALILDRNLMPLWVVAFAFTFTISSRLSFVAPFAYHKGITRVGWYFAVYSGIAVTLRLFGGNVLDRLGVERILGPAMGLLGIGVAILALTGTSGALLGAAVLGGVGHSYAYPALSAMIISHTPAGAFGRSSVVYTSVFDSASMLAPYLLGIIASLWGYAPMFVIAGLVSVCAAVYFDALARRCCSLKTCSE
jgi:MFS family permease